MTRARATLCTGGCGRLVNRSLPHVVMSITIQARRTDGTTHIQATNVLGTWHPRCARTWNPEAP